MKKQLESIIEQDPEIVLENLKNEILATNKHLLDKQEEQEKGIQINDLLDLYVLNEYNTRIILTYLHLVLKSNYYNNSIKTQINDFITNLNLYLKKGDEIIKLIKEELKEANKQNLKLTPQLRFKEKFIKHFEKHKELFLKLKDEFKKYIERNKERSKYDEDLKENKEQKVQKK